MTKIFIALVVLGAVTPNTWAAIDGNVVNGTTGKPQAGVSVTLLKPGQQGMRSLGVTISDSAGHFGFQNDEPGGGPQLLQAAYNGVNYNKLLTPNVPTSGVDLEIYEATKSPAVAEITQQMLLIEPNSSQIAISQSVVVRNDSKTTYNNTELGGLVFFLPPAANGQVRVNAQGPQGMPLPRTPEKTSERDVFKIDFPIKPGQTEFDINYVLPAGSPFTFRGRVVNVKGMRAGPLRLIVPSGVSLSGKDVQSLGTEPKTQLAIYNVIARDSFLTDITGTGSIRDNSDNSSGDESDSPQVREGEPQVYAHLPWLVGLTFAILGVGLLMLFRNSPVRAPYTK